MEDRKELNLPERTAFIVFGFMPYNPIFYDWDYMTTEDNIAAYLAPLKGVDVLVTHTPPSGILDQVDYQGLITRTGSMALRDFIDSADGPYVSIFGHIHEGYGYVQHGRTACYNVAVCNSRYHPVNKPTVIEV